MYVSPRRSAWHARYLPVSVLLPILALATGAAPAGAQPPPAITGQPGQPQPPRQPMPGRPEPMRPARDPAAPPVTGTARIRGTVVALDSGTPLRRVQVRIMGEQLRNGRGVVTDAEGRFEINDLPAGRFQLMASKGGYVTLQYGQRRPNDWGRPLQVADGQTLDKIQFALPRGGVIVGRIVDETGELATDVSVTAMQMRNAGGRKRLMPVARPGMTNDIGQYRIYGLPPGEYYVSAGSRGQFYFGEGAPEDNTGYAPTYYPGTPSLSEAQRVTVALGEEVAVDLALIPTKVSRISGSVVDSTGKALASGMIRMQTREETGMPGGSGAEIRPDGTFVINGVQPGSYYLTAIAGQMMMGPADERESATIPITVSGQDLTDLRLATSTGSSIKGRVIFEGGQAPANARLTLACTAPDLDGPMMGMGSGLATVDAQQQFELKSLMRPCQVRTMMPIQGWTLKAVRHEGDDVTDRTIDVTANKVTTGVEVILTDRVTTLSGAVTDAQGQPLKEFTAIAFSDDKEKWTFPTRHVRSARGDQDGQFKITGLPPGNYLVVALDSLQPGDEMDPELLERMRAQGTAARLSEGGTQSLTLKLATP